MDDNVTPIGPRQKKKQAESKKADNTDKLTTAQRQMILADWIDFKVGDIMGCEPPQRFAIWAREDYERVVVEIVDDEILVSDISAVCSMVTTVCRERFTESEIWQSTDRLISSAVNFWFMSAIPIKNPPRYGWKGEPGIVIRRIPYERQEGPTPTWDELMSRISNAEALQCFIGSVLVSESYVQQYVWLYGQGGEGKGELAKFLSYVLGHTHTSQQVPGLNDRFWTWGIRHSRLVVFADCNNRSFVTSGLFKSLTGDDSVRVEVKGGRVLHQRIGAKYLFLSNEKPDLSSEVADRRRIIYCEASAHNSKHNRNYDKLLMKEGGHFLTKCLNLYLSRCPDHGPIEADHTAILEIINENEDDYETFLHSNFYTGPSQECSRAAFQARINEKWKSRKDQNAFKDYLRRQGIQVRARKNTQGNVDRYWSGIRLREAVLVGVTGVDPALGGQ